MITLADIQKDGWKHETREGSATALGPIWSRETKDGVEFGFLSTPDHAAMDGHVDHGALLAFADHYVGSAAIPLVGVAQVTIQLQTNFVQPVNIGEFVTGLARVDAYHDRLVSLYGQMKVGDRLISTSMGIWKNVTPMAKNKR